jgi:hypothetical protein
MNLLSMIIKDSICGEIKDDSGGGTFGKKLQRDEQKFLSFNDAARTALGTEDAESAYR